MSQVSDCSVGAFLRKIAASIERYRFEKHWGIYDGFARLGKNIMAETEP